MKHRRRWQGEERAQGIPGLPGRVAAIGDDDGGQGGPPDRLSVDALTGNFPPCNCAADGKHFARQENLEGIAVDTAREMRKRAGIPCNLTELRRIGEVQRAFNRYL